jgi:thioredoxin reductase
MIQETYDVIILNAGPAGLQAAIHAARTKVSISCRIGNRALR